MIATFLLEPQLGGGAAVVVNQVANSLGKEGYQISIITTWPGKGIKSDLSNGIKVIRIPASNLYWIAQKEREPLFRKFFWQLIDTWNPLIYRLVKEVIVQESPDIFHSHKLRGLSPSIWSAAKSAGAVKIIHTCHDYELISPQGLLLGKVGRWAAEQHPLLRPYQSIRRSVSKLVEMVTSPGRYTLSIHEKLNFFPGAQKKVVPNSHGLTLHEVETNCSASKKATSPKPKKPLRVLYLGRLEKEKGIIFLCDVFNELIVKNSGINLDIAGYGSLLPSIQNLFQSPNIQFHGSVFGEKKEILLQTCDILIVPSLCAEVSPTVILEAYSRGKPVIISNLGGMPELVETGKTGYIFEAGNNQELIDLLIRLGSDPIMVGTLSSYCFEKSKEFTTENLAKNYIHSYLGN